MKDLDTRYLERLRDLYPTIARASTEIINLQAILSLPKGTEHFITDVHGEDEAFNHVLKNGSGAVRRKIDQIFGNSLTNADKKALATLIYYPKEKMHLVRKTEKNMDDWYRVNLYRLIEVSKLSSSKYTRSKLRKALPQDFAYVIEELITEKAEVHDKETYYNEIINTIIRIDRAPEFIVEICNLIQRLIVDQLHILGDIYDRGPGPHRIMETLMSYHSVDIQWGNHDVVWMGAAAGQMACIATVIRNCARYGNMDILEEGYGINLIPLVTFAERVYGDDPCDSFKLKSNAQDLNPWEIRLEQKVHKAITIIQMKVEGLTIAKHPEFDLDDRRLLHLIDYEKGTITLDGITYPLNDTNFPTIDPENPYELSEAEADVCDRLEKAFLGCEKLQEHMRFLLSKGNLYKVFNNNLLYHGCVPLNEDGSLKEVEIYGEKLKGKALYDCLEQYIRKGFFAKKKKEREKGRDICWYIWLSPNSPLFGKDKMATFESYFIDAKEAHAEKKTAYYQLLEKEEIADMILEEFGLDKSTACIVNGHVPVKFINGESPIKANGKVLVIDGGFSKAYQKVTGIAGYTLVYNSHGMQLVAHEPFESTEAAIRKESDIHSSTTVVNRTVNRVLVGDTDIGQDIKEQIQDLEVLLESYRNGLIKEKV